jgi:hypothetical protein
MDNKKIVQIAMIIILLGAIGLIGYTFFFIWLSCDKLIMLAQTEWYSACLHITGIPTRC